MEIPCKNAVLAHSQIRTPEAFTKSQSSWPSPALAIRPYLGRAVSRKQSYFLMGCIACRSFHGSFSATAQRLRAIIPWHTGFLLTLYRWIGIIPTECR